MPKPFRVFEVSSSRIWLLSEWLNNLYAVSRANWKLASFTDERSRRSASVNDHDRAEQKHNGERRSQSPRAIVCVVHDVVVECKPDYEASYCVSTRILREHTFAFPALWRACPYLAIPVFSRRDIFPLQSSLVYRAHVCPWLEAFIEPDKSIEL